VNVTCGRCGTLNAEVSRCRECGDRLHQIRERRRTTRKNRLTLILALVVVPILIVASLLVVVLEFFKTYSVSSGAMQPTLQIHDVLLVDQAAYRASEPEDGDIVVFYPPLRVRAPFLERVIGTPGETLRIHGGRLYRNAAPVNESYVAEPTAYELEIKNYAIYVDGVALPVSEFNVPPRQKWTSPDTIPRGCYVLMGDNRNNSEDSHIWGFAQRDGLFYSGIQAGQPARSFEKVTQIIAPSNHARSF
jgi:signal peptidase I